MTVSKEYLVIEKVDSIYYELDPKEETLNEILQIIETELGDRFLDNDTIEGIEFKVKIVKLTEKEKLDLEINDE